MNKSLKQLLILFCLCEFIIPMPLYAQTIDQVAQYNAAQAKRLAATDTSVGVSSTGNFNQLTIQQIGYHQQISGNQQNAAVISGNGNTVDINQGDVISRQGQSLIELGVAGDFNSLNINQGTTTTGASFINDFGDHYQNLQIYGSFNVVESSQIGQNHYASMNINGNNNNQTLVQTGTGHQAFTSINGNDNNINSLQNGNGQHFLDLSLTGDGNSATVEQSGNTQNRATVSIINAGGPAGINLTQTGGQTYSLQTVCVTPAGCGTTTVKQGH